MVNEPHYRVKDWQDFQHYKQRNPPWIRLYKNILDKPEIHELSDKGFRILICLWLLASEDKYLNGNLPPSSEIAFRLRMPKATVCKHLEELSRFITADASTMLAPCLHDATPETEAVADAEAKTNTDAHLRNGGALDGFDQFWQAYPRKMNKPDAQKAYKQVKAAQHLPDILNSLEKHKAWTGWTKDGGQFIPYPASWLRATGWENEMEITGLARLGMAVGSDTSWD